MLQRLRIDGLLFFVPSEGGGVAFTSRPGGVSKDRFRGLNLSHHTKDGRENVTENRRVVSRALGIPSDWAAVRQVHGAQTVKVDEGSGGRLGSKGADAIVTSATGLPMAVMIADCLPIAVVGEATSGVIHAGWRGLCLGLIESAVEALGEPHPRAWIGPSIGPCHYEVGPEVVERFKSKYSESPKFWKDGERGIRFDLRAAARWALRAGGAVVDDDDPPCTACDPSFYSYRRDGETGRQAALVWRP